MTRMQFQSFQVERTHNKEISRYYQHNRETTGNLEKYFLHIQMIICPCKGFCLCFMQTSSVFIIRMTSLHTIGI